MAVPCSEGECFEGECVPECPVPEVPFGTPSGSGELAAVVPLCGSPLDVLDCVDGSGERLDTPSGATVEFQATGITVDYDCSRVDLVQLPPNEAAVCVDLAPTNDPDNPPENGLFGIHGYKYRFVCAAGNTSGWSDWHWHYDQIDPDDI